MSFVFKKYSFFSIDCYFRLLLWIIIKKLLRHQHLQYSNVLNIKWPVINSLDNNTININRKKIWGFYILQTSGLWSRRWKDNVFFVKVTKSLLGTLTIWFHPYWNHVFSTRRQETEDRRHICWRFIIHQTSLFALMFT